LKILWSSNGPWVGSGYGTQTRTMVPRIKALGHEMAILAWYGLMGGIIEWAGIPIFPRGGHPYGEDVLDKHARMMGADIAITLYDSWVRDPSLHQDHPARWCPLFPVDTEPILPQVVDRVSSAYQPIVYSKFGQREAGRAGLDVRYVPHGIDTKVFKPADRAEMRRRVGMPADRYIVGMVAANQGHANMPHRKSYPQAITAFAQFKRKHPDAFLYLYAKVDGEFNGLDILGMLEHFGLRPKADYMLCDPYGLVIGTPDAYMAATYNSFDVLLSPSMAEGFGLPILEAQACGVPVITGDWTSMSELTWKGIAIPKSGAEPYWFQQAKSWMFLPHVGAIVEALENVYARAWDRKPPTPVAEYDADYVVAHYWKPVLDEIAERIAGETPATPVAVHSNGHKPEAEKVPA
jgi:glycosyltransferase involved in cell wall biosynthesis